MEATATRPILLGFHLVPTRESSEFMAIPSFLRFLGAEQSRNCSSWVPVVPRRQRRVVAVALTLRPALLDHRLVITALAGGQLG